MKYEKPALSFNKQVQLLLDRGLIADKKVLKHCLQSVNYYRLSGYLYPFKQKDESFEPNTRFEMIWKNYCFDRALRLLIFEACSVFETSIKTDFIYYFSDKYGPFGYLDKNNFQKMNLTTHEQLISKITEETKRSKEIFLSHFFKKYGDSHECLPLWMLAEIISFGTIHTMYNGVDFSLKKIIAKKYNISDKVLMSWISTIQVIRNICAHNGRIYNRTLGVKPLIPNKNAIWHNPKTIDNKKVFSVLSILTYLLKIIEPDSIWQKRIFELIKENDQVPLSVMGFYDGWENCSLWKN